MSKSNAVRLRDEAKQTAVAIKTPWPTLFNKFQSRLVVPVEKRITQSTRWVLVGEIERLRAIPLRRHHRNQAIWKYAPDRGVRGKILELHFMELQNCC